MLKIEKKSIRVIYTRLFEMRLFFSPTGFQFAWKFPWFAICICIIRKGKGNFKGNNRSIGFDLFEYRLRVKKWSNSPPPLVFHYQNRFIDDQILYTLFTKWFHHLYNFFQSSFIASYYSFSFAIKSIANLIYVPIM